MRSSAKVFAAAVLSMSAIVTPAQADPTIQWATATDDAGGQPQVGVAGGLPNGDTIEVFRCPANGACDAQPLPQSGTDAFSTRFDAGTTAAGDVFEARYSQGGVVVTTSRTPAWTGPAALLEAPALQGGAVVGTTVKAVAAKWSGQWAEPWSSSTAGVYVCKTTTGSDCVVLAFGDTAASLDAQYAGWYVFAGSGLSSGSGYPPVSLAAPPYAVAQLSATSTFALTAPLGPITAAPVDAPKVPVVYTPEPPKAPSATIRARALRGKRGLNVGRVTCQIRCAVKLTVTGGGRTIHRTLSVQGTKTLIVARRHGKLKVRVVVNGKALATGTSRAR